MPSIDNQSLIQPRCRSILLAIATEDCQPSTNSEGRLQSLESPISHPHPSCGGPHDDDAARTCDFLALPSSPKQRSPPRLDTLRDLSPSTTTHTSRSITDIQCSEDYHLDSMMIALIIRLAGRSHCVFPLRSVVLLASSAFFLTTNHPVSSRPSIKGDLCRWMAFTITQSQPLSPRILHGIKNSRSWSCIGSRKEETESREKETSIQKRLLQPPVCTPFPHSFPRDISPIPEFVSTASNSGSTLRQLPISISFLGQNPPQMFTRPEEEEGCCR